jgi:hypothetical protein
MDRTTADINEICVPSDGGAITTALASLDERLTAWGVAMREACRQLTDAASRRTPVAAQEPDAAAAPAAHAPAAEPSSRLEPPPPVVVQPTVVEINAEPKSPAAPSGRVETAGAQPAVMTPSQETASATTPATSTESASAAAPEPVKVLSAAEQDEALLATLDPETAKAIKVMRRLSPEHKSVKEWLAEYKASGSAQPPVAQSKKKSWFSRG